ncbi:MAG: glycosyltransferase [Candidatus Bathyarchaeia archaeon]
MRVYVSPCGLGLGHITRTVPIVEELRSRGVEVTFSTYLDGLEYARARGYRLARTVPISFKVKADGTVDFKQTAARSGLSLGLRRFLKQVVAEIKNMKRFRPDVVFSDSRASSIIAARLLGIPVILMLNQFRVEIVRRPSVGRLSPMDRLFFLIANIFWIFVRTLIGGVWAQSRLILIPDLPHPYTISVRNLAVPRRYMSKVRLVGPILGFTPEALPSREEIAEELSLPVNRPIVYVAISGPRVERKHLRDSILSVLRASTPDLTFIISCGRPGGRTEPSRSSNITEYEWMDDETQSKVLKASDIVICRSGHGIIMKALTFGKPLLLIPTPDHTEQYGNAERAVELGAAIMLEQWALRTGLQRSLHTILSSPTYRARAEEISEVALRLNPVSDVADLVMGIAGDEAGAE